MEEKKCNHCGTKEDLVIQGARGVDEVIVYSICHSCKKKLCNKSPSLETREKLRQANLGLKQSQETILKRKRTYLDGHATSKETREKIRIANTGFKHSYETKEKIRQLKTGVKQSPETIAKRVAKNTGKKHPPRTEEFKMRMSILMKEKMNNEETMRKVTIANIKKVKFMKHTNTSIEKKMARLLYKMGIEYIHNHPMFDIKNACNVDFFIPKQKMVIECDGEYWHNYPVGNPMDHIREKQLKEKGYKVLRFWGNQINKHIDFVEFVIDKHSIGET